MKGDESVGRELGQHPVDQSGKSLSVPVMIESVDSGDGISGRSSSVPRPLDNFGVGVDNSFAPLSLSSRLRTRGNLLAPSKYDAFVKTTPSGPKPAILVRLFLVPVGSLGTTLCGGRIGESNLQACISLTLPTSSGCAVQRHVNKETRLVEGCLYIPASSSSGKASVFIEPTLPVSSLPPSKIQSLMLEERTAEAWTSLLPRILSLPASEASSLAAVLDETSGKSTDYLSPSKLKRARLSASDSFHNNTFLSSVDSLLTTRLRGLDPTMLDSVLPVILDHADDVANTLQLVGRAVVATSEGFSTDLSSLEVEVGLLRDTLGTDPGLAGIQLRTAWEGLQWLHAEFKALESTFESKQSVTSGQVASSIAASLSSVNNKIVDIENVVLEEMARLQNLFVVCSGGESRPAGEALVVQFNLIASRLAALEAKGSFRSPMFSNSLPLVDSTTSTEILALKSSLSSIVERQKDMQACIGQLSVEIGGVRFESLPQTITWVRTNLLSGAYYLFLDAPILLDMVTSSNMSDKEFLEEKFQASRGKFENETAAKVAASFNRELPSIFGRVDATSSGHLVSTHPLPLIKLREC